MKIRIRLSILISLLIISIISGISFMLFFSEKQLLIRESIARRTDSTLAFAEVAKEVSMDATTSVDGGYLAWHEIATLQETAKAFATNIRDLKPGEISEPFKSQYGFHVIKVLNRRDARPYNLEEDYDLVKNYALNAKKQDEFNEWINELRSEMYIEVKER